MKQVLAFPDVQRRPTELELSADSRVAIILDNVQRLAEAAAEVELPDATSPKFIREVLAARTLRRHFFDSDLFADPAWDMLLELYALRAEQRRTSVSKLCFAAGVPPTTALRWIDKLHKEGLIDRASDPLDGRRVWVELSDDGFDAMRSYLHRLEGGGARPI